MKCVSCGKDAVIEDFCKDCYIKKNPLLLTDSEIKINICSNCAKIYTKGVWKPFSDVESGIHEIILSKLKFKQFLKIDSVDLNLDMPALQVKPGIKTKGFVRIDITATLDNTVLSREYILPLTIEVSSCPVCGKKGTQYFEGVLQIRNPNEIVLEYIDKKLAGEDRVFLSKISNLKTGVDYYLSSQKFIQVFANELYSEFGGELKITKRLFTRDKSTSKEVYRVNALLRLPDFEKGDIIKIRNTVLLVKDVKGRNVIGLDINLDKPASYDYKLFKCEIVSKKKDLMKTTVSQIYPTVEILDPVTYQPVKVKNSKDVKPGEKVKVALVDGYYYLV